MNSEILIKPTPGPNKFVVDSVRSPVIEFMPGVLNENRLTRGRFYFGKSYHEDGELVAKKKEFCSWADEVFHKTRRSLLAGPKNFGAVYVGKHAREWSEKEGNSFVLF